MSLPHYEERVRSSQRAGEAVGSIWPSRLCSLVEICLKIGSLSAINFSHAESQDFPERLLCVWQRVFCGLPRSSSGKAGKPRGGVWDVQSHLPHGHGWGNTRGAFAKPVSCWKIPGSLMNSVLEINPLQRCPWHCSGQGGLVGIRAG